MVLDAETYDYGSSDTNFSLRSGEGFKVLNLTNTVLLMIHVKLFQSSILCHIDHKLYCNFCFFWSIAKIVILQIAVSHHLDLPLMKQSGLNVYTGVLLQVLTFIFHILKFTPSCFFTILNRWQSALPWSTLQRKWERGSHQMKGNATLTLKFT